MEIKVREYFGKTLLFTSLEIVAFLCVIRFIFFHKTLILLQIQINQKAVSVPHTG